MVKESMWCTYIYSIALPFLQTCITLDTKLWEYHQALLCDLPWEH
jgi:hypothetical protein